MDFKHNFYILAVSGHRTWTLILYFHVLGRSLLCLTIQTILTADAEFDFLFFPSWKGSGTENCWFRGTCTILELLLHLPVPILKEFIHFIPASCTTKCLLVCSSISFVIPQQTYAHHSGELIYNTVLCSCFMERHTPITWKLMKWDHQSKSIMH